MPLDKTNNKEAFVNNVKELLRAGKPKKQALAISYDVKRKASDKKK